MNTCFFIGHRETSDSIFPALLQAVERHITEYGVTEFVVGHYGNFDRLAARAVLKAKERHPQVTLFLLLPYHPADRPIPGGLRRHFLSTWHGAGTQAGGHRPGQPVHGGPL